MNETELYKVEATPYQVVQAATVENTSGFTVPGGVTCEGCICFGCDYAKGLDGCSECKGDPDGGCWSDDCPVG